MKTKQNNEEVLQSKVESLEKELQQYRDLFKALEDIPNDPLSIRIAVEYKGIRTASQISLRAVGKSPKEALDEQLPDYIKGFLNEII